MRQLFLSKLLLATFFGLIKDNAIAQKDVAETVAEIKTTTPRFETKQYQLFEDASKHQLRIVDRSTQQTLRLLNLQDKQGKPSRLSAILHHAQRQSFILVLPDIAELWELSYDPKAEPVYQGWVHDYQMGEGIADSKLFAPRKTPLTTALDCFILDPLSPYLAGADQHGKFQIINLDIRRKISELQFAHPVFPCESVIEHENENGKGNSVLRLKMKPVESSDTKTDSQVILLDMKTGRMKEK